MRSGSAAFFGFLLFIGAVIFLGQAKRHPELWVFPIGISVIAAAIYLIRKGVAAARQLRDTHQHNQILLKEISESQREVDRKIEYLKTMRQELDTGVIRGRKWLAQYIAEADKAYDESIVGWLEKKKKPALRAAAEVSLARTEKREWKDRAKYLEYQLKSYQEYFPFLEEYEDALLDEAINLVPKGNNLAEVEKADPVLKWLPKSDYEALPPRERNQLALSRYLEGHHTQAEIGRMYERYIGYVFERDGWDVEYHGIIEGYEDLGRDLICRKDGMVNIIQAKCWSKKKLIREKHIFQLYGTTQLWMMNQPDGELKKLSVFATLMTSTSLSEVARRAAKWLKINVQEVKPLLKNYPMVKCNINQATKEKIYHLPFDQQYDRTKIISSLGEFYASTAAEAEENGFRRAHRYYGPAE